MSEDVDYDGPDVAEVAGIVDPMPEPEDITLFALHAKVDRLIAIQILHGQQLEWMSQEVYGAIQGITPMINGLMGGPLGKMLGGKVNG